MRLLLDTHAFLWFITNDSQLSAAARVLITDQLRCSVLERNGMERSAVSQKTSRKTNRRAVQPNYFQHRQS